MDNLIISVGRQLGSGGCEIAKKLAVDLGCKFYDHELINMAAERSGFNPKIFEQQDESHGTLKTLFGAFSGRLGRMFNEFYSNSMSQEELFQIQSEVIFKAAKTENCVFVGRCADYILRNKQGLFSVFITADDADRVRVVAERQKFSESEARRYIERCEAQRAAYYNFYTSKKWGAAASYDLCVNSSMLGWEGTAELIESVIKQKMER
ncbi:MAG: cytidylate kinase-like family protein [Prevotella sp.]|nr:cytidylate kinase-like family protein [Prevotella sp.]